MNELGMKNGYRVIACPKLSDLADAITALKADGISVSSLDWNGYDDGNVYVHDGDIRICLSRSSEGAIGS